MVAPVPKTAFGPPAAEAELIACTTCDALYTVVEPPAGGRLRCQRCHAVLLRTPGRALDTVLAAGVAIVVLIVSALFFPFLQVSASGLSSSTSVAQTALAFSGGLTAPLVVALAVVIFVVPVLRAALLTYSLLPMRLGRPLLPMARGAFRLATELRPWSMAEVFVVGVVVALVKVGGMASVSLGPAFWMLCLIVLIVVLEASSLCEKTIWRAIELHDRS
jgi:paraquat-inducible protein A